MDLPRPPSGLDPELLRFLTTFVEQVNGADKQNRKTVADVEVASGQRFITTDTVTGDRVQITVAAGVVTVTAL